MSEKYLDPHRVCVCSCHADGREDCEDCCDRANQRALFDARAEVKALHDAVVEEQRLSALRCKSLAEQLAAAEAALERARDELHRLLEGVLMGPNDYDLGHVRSRVSSVLEATRPDTPAPAAEQGKCECGQAVVPGSKFCWEHHPDNPRFREVSLEYTGPCGDGTLPTASSHCECKPPLPEPMPEVIVGICLSCGKPAAPAKCDCDGDSLPGTNLCQRCGKPSAPAEKGEGK